MNTEKFTEMPDRFRITDRSFNKIINIVGLKESEIMSLPDSAVILEVGSGTNQAFARAVKELRPDILCVSLDPTLAIKPEDYVTTVSDWKDRIPTAIYYDNYSANTPSEQDYSEKIRQLRITEANKTGNVVAGLAPNLPIRDNSVDLIIDSWAAGYYLDKNTDNFIDYIHNISRVLKPAGKARVYPVFDKQTFRLNFEEFRSKFPDVKIDLIEGSVFLGLSISKR